MKKVIIAAVVVAGLIASAFGLSLLCKKEFAVLSNDDDQEE